MDPAESDSKKLLQDILDLAKENNQILSSIRRSQRIGTYTTAAYWLLVIGIALGSIYFLQPYVDKIQQFWVESGATLNQLKNFGNTVPK